MSEDIRGELKNVRIRWTDLPSDLLAALICAGFPTEVRREAFYCHEFVKTICHDLGGPNKDWAEVGDDLNVLDVCRGLLQTSDDGWIDDGQWYSHLSSMLQKSVVERLCRTELKTRASYVGKRGRDVYFAAAHHYAKSDFFGVTKQQLTKKTPVFDARKNEQPRKPILEVLNLSSVRDDSLRELTVSAFLDMEWRAAIAEWERRNAGEAGGDPGRLRMIVVDEAHNLIPARPATDADAVVRNQFARVAAEGRKYGIFLIVMSQRPDKLDPWVLSECENRLIMRVGSRSVLAETRRLLGLDDVPEYVLERCLRFGKGRGLMTGKWTPNNQKFAFVYGAARRTRPGGDDMKSDAWARWPEKTT